MLLVLWIDRPDFSPKLFRVIHLASVAQFVNQHIIEQLERQIHQRNI